MDIREIFKVQLENDPITEEYIQDVIRERRSSGVDTDENDIRHRYPIGDKQMFVAVRSTSEKLEATGVGTEIIRILESELDEFDAEYQLERAGKGDGLPLFEPRKD